MYVSKEEYTIFTVGQDGSREATYNIGVETLFRLKIAGSTVTSYTSTNYNSYTMGLANLNFYEDKGYVEGYTKAKGNICFTLNGADGNTYTVKLNIMEVDDSNHFHTITWNVVKEPSKEAATCLADFGWREGVCSTCGAFMTGEYMINVGNGHIMNGYFDEEAADEVVYYTDRSRRLGTQSLAITADGKPVAIYCARHMKVTEDMREKAMLRAAQTASYYVLNGANDGIHDDRLTAGENFACGQGTALEAYVDWCMSRDHARTMIGDWAYTGVACFMADINENGGAYPIWIQVFDNRTYEEERWNVAGDTIIQNTEDGIPDKNFYESALEQCDYNKDGKLGENEAAFGMNMDFSNKGIENIQGIQYFTGMPHMDFSGNKIKDLTPFAELAKVEYFGNIDFRDNQISDISMLENVDVESLNLSNNQISDLEVLQKMKSCKAIDLGGNRITDISSVKGSQISSIGLSRNGLTSVESLAGGSYGQLDLSHNQIHDLSPLAGCTVKGIDWSHNQVTTEESLVLSKLEGLRSVTLDENQITDISWMYDREFSFIQIQNNPLQTIDGNLTAGTISLAGNQIRSIQGTLKGDSIDVSNNQIVEIARPIESNDMDLSHNQLKNLATTEGQELISKAEQNSATRLDFSYNQLEDISKLSEANFRFTSLNLSHNKIQNLTALRNLSFYYSLHMDKVNLLNVDLSYNQITDLSSLKDSGFATRMAVYFLEAEKYSEGIWKNGFVIGEGNAISEENALQNLPEDITFMRYYNWQQKVYSNYFWYEMENLTQRKKIVPDGFTGLHTKPGPGGTQVLGYFTDGVMDLAYEDLAEYEGVVYFVGQGVIRSDYTGTVYKTTSGTAVYGRNVENVQELAAGYQIVGGKLDISYEGINDVETKAGCPYAVCDLAFKNGRLRTDYTGVAVATSDGVNGVIERPIYVRNGIADYSFEGGKYCPNYTGVAESFGNRMDYYVENGNINTERNEAYMEEVDGYL